MHQTPHRGAHQRKITIKKKSPTTENDDNEQDKHFEHVFTHSLILVQGFLLLP